MKIGNKEIVTGGLFALFVAIFINYNSIERIFNSTRGFTMEMLYPLLFSIAWFFVISIIYYMLYATVYNFFYGGSRVLMAISIVAITLVVSYILVELYPTIRDMVIPEQFITRRHMPDPNPDPNRMILVQRGFNSREFMHMLVAILNLLFVSIQRLLFRNQEIERHNEQLHLQSVKSQHSALVQQINPHFFFNSLSTLRYIIQKGEGEDAIDFLDNLTSIFRRTLKLNANTQHTLGEEMALTTSYMHIIERRFEGKISVDFAIDEAFNDYMLSPLSILTLMENVIKHNTISTKRPVSVKIQTTPSGELIVENNIVPKFDEVESNGIGLINLNKQYELVTGRGIEVLHDKEIFRVKLPLLKPTV